MVQPVVGATVISGCVILALDCLRQLLLGERVGLPDKVMPKTLQVTLSTSIGLWKGTSPASEQYNGSVQDPTNEIAYDTP